MYNMLQHMHSGLRWIVLLLLVMAVFSAFSKMKQNKTAYTSGDKKLFFYNLIGAHIQTLIGLILYFISPKVQFGEGMMKVTELRFFAVEHISLMLIAIILITIGYSKSKKQEAPGKYKTLFIFNLIALILILISIPWPFRGLGTGWF